MATKRENTPAVDGRPEKDPWAGLEIGQSTPDQQRLAQLEADKAELEAIVFGTEAGKRLLANWTEDVLMSPSYEPHYPRELPAHIEGRKDFVRGIIRRVRSVAEGKHK